MLALTDAPTLDAATCSQLRSIEAEELLEAITDLRGAGILSGAEYEAKRQRLTSRL
ncbi:MAG: hypothetical protein AB8G14_14060 [Ilumatobacter sp.]